MIASMENRERERGEGGEREREGEEREKEVSRELHYSTGKTRYEQLLEWYSCTCVRACVCMCVSECSTFFLAYFIQH